MTGFPLLTAVNHEETSPVDPDYNCIAWAAGSQDRVWWPDEDYDGYWPPPPVTRAETINAFLEAYQSLGYVVDPNADHSLEEGVEKVALFALGEEPTHAARQLPNGKWTSKMGPEQDISHEWGVLDGPCYGRVVRILRREAKQEVPTEMESSAIVP